ncbi:hypothetical protein RND71_012032 [Anisodus tanguticus]|uniref:AT-hook motif nuclear-localized protein n=1 Tax=Anisodus tanguticus TaxID=243964 RepID=A0AAE1SEE6_9SOLA|nr:hypothetical protein RND71_012032 [Anisodus tanguticus]
MAAHMVILSQAYKRVGSMMHNGDKCRGGIGVIDVTNLMRIKIHQKYIEIEKNQSSGMFSQISTYWTVRYPNSVWFLLSESGGQRSRTGGLSVSIAGPDGRVLGGGVAGLLTAAAAV